MKDPSKFKKILVKREKEDNEEDNDNLKYIIEEKIVKKFEKHFEENPGSAIGNVGEVKKVSKLYYVFFFIY